MRITAPLLLAALLAGCSAAPRAPAPDPAPTKSADGCKPLPGKRVIWCKDTDGPMPLHIERALRQQSGQ